MIDHFAPGDVIFHTTIKSGKEPGSNPFCGEVDGPDYTETTLACSDEDAVIDSIEFADWGTPLGSCRDFHHASCTTPKTAQFVEQLCLGQHDCVIQPYPALGDPCVDVVKRFVVQATCNNSGGGSATNTSGSVFGLGMEGHDGNRKVLVINKTLNRQTVTLEGIGAGIAYAVDPLSVTKGGPQGVRTFAVSGSLTLEPFAVVVLVEGKMVGRE